MRRSIGFFALALICHAPQPARGGAFATELTQLLNHAELVMQYARQGLQLAEQIKQTADMIKNSRTTDDQVFGEIDTELDSLHSIVQGGLSLAYSLANLDALFRTRFPGYRYNERGYYVDYKLWSQTSLDTSLGALRAAGLQRRQLRSEQSVLNTLRGMARRTEGRLQALQVMGQIAEQQVQQLMKLRALMMADMSSKHSYQAAMMQKDATSEAAVERFFRWLPGFSDRKTFQSGWK